MAQNNLEKPLFFIQNDTFSYDVKPHHLPKHKKQLAKAAFAIKGHNGDTFFINGKRMRPPSKPAIDRSDSKKYFIFWNHDVPRLLWPYYDRKRIRIKMYDDINRYKGEEREQYAELRRVVWEHSLFKENFNPFEDELEALAMRHDKKTGLIAEIKEKQKLTPEQKRKLTPLDEALELFIKSREERTNNKNSISTQRGVIKWLLAYFKPLGLDKIPVSKVTRLQISDALLKAKKDNSWQPTTFNNNLDLAMTVFTWFAKEEYIDKNPAIGKIDKMPGKKKKHKWYDRDTAAAVKKAVLDADKICLYRAMQFTYWLMIRSQSELFKLKFGDIDRVLKRTRFSEDLSKNSTEQFRDYPVEFDKVLDEMDFNKYPKDWFIFGKSALPSPYPSGKNQLSKTFQPIREGLHLSSDYTIYGWKHTRIIHEMMKGTDGYKITYMARHGDTKTTEDYKRDYDFTLSNIYGPEDLTF